MTVEIESILQHEEIQGLLENAEATGSIRQVELAELVEVHQLDALETDAFYNELDRRGIEIVDEHMNRSFRHRCAPPVSVYCSHNNGAPRNSQIAGASTDIIGTDMRGRR